MIRNALVSMALKYGLISGLFSVLSFFLLEYLGKKPMVNASMLLINGLLFIVFIFFAVKEYKDMNHGELRFWQGMSLGFGVYLITAISFSIFIVVYFNALETKMIEYKQDVTEMLGKSAELYPDTYTEEVINNQREEVQNITPIAISVSAFFKLVFIGMLVSPIISIVLRK